MNKLILIFSVILILNNSLLFSISDYDLEYLESEIFQLVNEYRISQGLNALQINEVVSEQCRGHSRNMAERYLPISHDGFTQRISNIKEEIVFLSAAENVAYVKNVTSPCSSAILGWINSPGHRRNMTGDFDHTGIGIAKADDGSLYFTQIFVKFMLSPSDSGYISPQQVEEEIFVMVNEQRSDIGRTELIWNEVISEQCRYYSMEIQKENTESGEIFDEIIEEIENVFPIKAISANISVSSGYEDPAGAAFDGWMEQNTNREGIEGDYDLIGIGVDVSEDGKYFIIFLSVKVEGDLYYYISRERKGLR